MNILHPMIITMHIPKRRRQKIDPRRHKLIHLFGSCHHPLQLRRVLHSILSALNSARRLPFTARPFFENKARAFWILQAVGWSGYLLLRGVVSISNGLSLDGVIPVIVEAIVGYCITLLLSTMYGQYRRMNRLVGIFLTIATLAAATFLPFGGASAHAAVEVGIGGGYQDEVVAGQVVGLERTREQYHLWVAGGERTQGRNEMRRNYCDGGGRVGIKHGR